MESHTLFSLLRDVLAELYPEEEDSRVVVADTGLDAKMIAFSARAQTNWHNIMAAAISVQQLDALLQAVGKVYGSNQAFSAATAHYHLFINQGGHIEPQAQLLDTGTVINGHKIIQEASKPRNPVILQRSLRRAAHFQDRKVDLDKLLASLQPGRIVTLCGPAGIGKTALAAEAVWQLAPGKEPPERFPDGIIFHDFKKESKATLVFEHIARSFGEELKPPLIEAAQRALAGRLVLLIFDSAEQADDLQLVLDIRDQAGVLITSRQRKDAVDKRQDVAPLPLDDAVSLLRAWGETRAIDENVMRRISDLAGRLPLALRLVGRYLAATEENASDYLAWLEKTPLVALGEIDSRESIPVLLTQSLAQVSVPARQVLEIVGLLALAPFTWEPIAVTLELSAIDARRALGELVNYGLLLRPAEMYEVTHALIHTYARLQLAPTNETLNQLVAYYTQLVAAHPAELDQLKSVRPHIMTLLRICREREAWSAAHDLAGAIESYLYLQGYWTDLVTALENRLTAARALQKRQEEGTCLGKLGKAYNILGQVEQSISFYEQALLIAQELGDRHQEGIWLGNMGISYRDLGKVKQAINCYQSALKIAQEIGDRRHEGVGLGNLGNAYRALGQVEQAIPFYEQALLIAQEIGYRSAEGIWLGNLGIAYSNLGQIERSLDYYQSALKIVQAIGEQRQEGTWLGHLGRAYADLGNSAQAITLCQQSLAIKRETSGKPNEGEALNDLGYAYASAGDFQRALELQHQAISILQEIGSKPLLSRVLIDLGKTHAGLGNFDQADKSGRQALAFAQEIGDRLGEAMAFQHLSLILRQQNKIDEASIYGAHALHIFEEIKSLNAATMREWLASLKEK